MKLASLTFQFWILYFVSFEALPSFFFHLKASAKIFLMNSITMGKVLVLIHGLYLTILWW